jgi:hypothetical protein
MALVKEYPIGTVVILYSSDSIYGIVVDRNFWLSEVRAEDPELAQYYLDKEKMALMIPILVLGEVIGHRVKKVDGQNVMNPYVKKYELSNVGGDIKIIPGGIKELSRTLWQMGLFFGNAVWLRSVKNYVAALELYFKNCYNKEDRNLMPLFEKALPRLAGIWKDG